MKGARLKMWARMFFIVALCTVTSDVKAQCENLNGLIWASTKDNFSLWLSLKGHDRGKVCEAGMNAYKSGAALLDYIDTHRHCATAKRIKQQREHLKTVVRNMNDFCGAGLPEPNE